jgi:hypothetical protein
LTGALSATAFAYAASYRRVLRKIVEQPDIAPGHRHAWLPPFGGSFETAIAQFSVRSLFRSRQHRMIYAFYLGIGLAFAILLLSAPLDISGPTTGDLWHQPSVPLLAASILVMGFSVAGARVVFSLPLDLGANWIFRIMPFRAGRRCLSARRRTLFALSVAPAWLIAAATIIPLWPWRAAAAHLAALAFFGIFLAEFSFDGAQKIPFTCSYLPGRSHINVTFLLWLYMILAGVLACATGERQALARPPATGAVLGGLGIAAFFALLRNNWLAGPSQAELRFEEIPPDQIVSLELS